MNAEGKSDEPILPATPANNDSAELSAESGEESGSTKRNVEQTTLSRPFPWEHGGPESIQVKSLASRA